MKHLILFVVFGLLYSCASDQSKIDNLQQELNTAQKELEDMKSAMEKEGIMHTVLVWLKDDISEEDRSFFEKECLSLKEIPQVSRFRMGEHAPTAERSIIDHSYSYAMNIEFDSMEDHDAYQVHPIHQGFIKKCSHLWEKVLVYDNKY